MHEDQLRPCCAGIHTCMEKFLLFPEPPADYTERIIICVWQRNHEICCVSDGLEPQTQYRGLKVELQLPKTQSHPEQAGEWMAELVTELK